MAKKKKELRPLSVDIETIRKQIVTFCEDRAYPNNAESSLFQTIEALRNDEVNCHRFLCPVDDYYNDKPVDFRKATARSVYFSMTNSVAKKLEISNIPLIATFYYSLLPKLKEKYEKAGYSDELFYDTVDYLRTKMYNGYRVFGTWGIFEEPDFSKIFTLEQFSFGRIAYTIEKSPVTAEFGGKKIERGHKVVACYFPTVDMPTMEECKESFKKAYEFFRKDLGDDICFLCQSWMLYPVHREFLKEGDPILTVMDCFHLVHQKAMRHNPDYWYIFNRFYKKDDKEDLFIDSPLEVKYDELIKKGGSMGRGTGIFFYDGKDFIL
ncbi:MAG: hypothetical protein J5781_05395 [Clostridia bacterium]|nr:hypothetical protein [Clostridia bacterium]